MKKSIIILIALMGLIVTGCQKENVTAPITPDKPDIPAGNLSAPYWLVSPNYDYSSSMTADDTIIMTAKQTSIANAAESTACIF